MSFVKKFTHYFLPHESNNFKAKIWHSSTLALIIISLFVFQAFLQVLPSVGVKILGYAANISPEEVIRLTNEKRAEDGLAPLSLNSVLSQAAQAKGNDMLNKDYWAHVAPDGTEPWSFFANAGYKYRYAGENLARDFSNSASIVEAWMASPTHRDNILSPKYKEIGMAVVEGDLNGVDTTIIVQFFGTQLSDSSEVVPVAASELKPTVVPKPVAEAKISEEAVAKASVVVSPFDLTRLVSVILIGGLMVIMVIDIVLSRRADAIISMNKYFLA